MMRIITEKKKIKIGKILAAAYFAVTKCIGEENSTVLKINLANVIDNITEVASEIGGETFAMIEIPMAVYNQQQKLGEK